eukprot:CAMPEP_0206507972 /NCGR_PEP_ID=MMETSP0324_2-20121206/57962_1 /ASSEMBLY_ACC=CAM_ASM_000836 /TAXON_ID=2866 /ORGANISM="Crypthecodinium cohnii, Strain Seligo" /LENGTH=53 /DNA_ID=CAMNT_0053998561 /DNA_START=380 /DNA_END=541 /DNA_ORIENTATION=-
MRGILMIPQLGLVQLHIKMARTARAHNLVQVHDVDFVVGPAGLGKEQPTSGYK